jgi:hypothetical protein
MILWSLLALALLAAPAVAQNPSVSGPTPGGQQFSGSVSVTMHGTNKFGANAGVNRLSDRLFVGPPLNDNAGNSFTGGGQNDWLSRAIPSTVDTAMLAAITMPGANAAAFFGARSSDTLAGAGAYTFSSGDGCLNDNLSVATNVICHYIEARTFVGAAFTQNIESNVINVNQTSVPQWTPYTAPTTPASSGTGPINLWLSNDRPDITTITIGGSATSGDIVSVTFAGGYTGSPQTISHTSGSRDTPTTIAAALVAAIEANATLVAGNFRPMSVGPTIVITGIGTVPHTVPSSSVSGAGTEAVTFGFGGNASAAIGIVNNSSLFSTQAGAYNTGILFDRYSITGTDGSDSATCCGEAIALARMQSIDFHNAGTAAGAPASRIYSAANSTVTTGMNLRFDGNSAVFEYGDGAWQLAVAPIAGATDYFQINGGKYSKAAGIEVVSRNPNASLNISTKGTGMLGIFASAVIITTLPTSCAGKPTGTLWNSSGTVHVC